MIHLILAAVVAFATPVPNTSPIAVPPPAPKATNLPPELRQSMIYADAVCEFAKLGHVVNAKLDEGKFSAAYPIGPWRLYCEKGELAIGWVKPK